MFRDRIASSTCVNLLVGIAVVLLPCRSGAVSEAVTEELLLYRSGGSDAGRMWPGFAAGDVSYDDAVTLPTVKSLNAPSMISPAAMPSLSGGDLSLPNVPFTGPNISVPGLAELGAIAANMMMPNLGTIPGLSSIPGIGGIPGANLSSLLGMFGVANLLNTLPNLLTMLNPQQLLNTLGSMVTMLTQFPQYIYQSLTGLYQGFAALGSMLVQAVTNPSSLFNPSSLTNSATQLAGAGQQGVGVGQQISGAQGGVAGSTPSTGGISPTASFPNGENLPPTGDTGGAPDGYFAARTGPAAVCFDGTGYYPQGDTHIPATAHKINGQYLNGDVTPYVVVNRQDWGNIPMGTKAYVYNHNTGLGTWAIAGDKGPVQGRSEISVATANSIGATIPRDSNGNMMNAIANHNISIYFYR